MPISQRWSSFSLSLCVLICCALVLRLELFLRFSSAENRAFSFSVIVFVSVSRSPECWHRVSWYPASPPAMHLLSGLGYFGGGLTPLPPPPFGSTTIEGLSPLSLIISATEYANNFWTPRTQAENHFKLSIFVNVISRVILPFNPWILTFRGQEHPQYRIWTKIPSNFAIELLPKAIS